jgi:hypothetical protein
MKMKKNLKQYLLFVTIILVFEHSYSQPPVISSVKIWDKAAHNAFTDLIRYNGAFYCTFREGSGHVPGVDGTIRVLRSVDGNEWESIALLEKKGYDLRDPGFSITPGNELMILMGGSIYSEGNLLGRNCQVAFLRNDKFSDIQPIRFEEGSPSKFNWLWKVKWFRENAYGVIYQWETDHSKIVLVSSENGIDYRKIHEFDIDGRPNEAAIRFLQDGEMMLLLRREDKGKNGLLGRSRYPYTDWQWIDTGFKLGGPNFLIGPGKSVIIGTRTYSSDGAHTGLISPDQNGIFRIIASFPSKGDTSYPGLVFHGKKLYISYYSSHEGKTGIYLSSLNVKELKKLIGKNSLPAENAWIQ